MPRKMTLRDRAMMWWLRRQGSYTTLDKYVHETSARSRRGICRGFAIVDAYVAGFRAGRARGRRSSGRETSLD